MTAAPVEPVRLAGALQSVAHLLDGAPFIGRHPVQPDDGDGWSRWYPDPDDPALQYQSVTWTISSTEWAPWLPQWAAKLASEQAAEHWADLGDMAAAVGWPAAVAWLKDEAKRQRELAAEVGTWHHDVLEAFLLDAPLPDPPAWILGRRLTTGGEDILICQETLDRWADGLVNFISDYRLTPVMAEATVCNPIEGYAGRVDLMAEFPGHGLGLVDLKSGQPRASVMAQLTAMRYATEVWLPLGARVDMPRAEWGAVLHLRQTWERGYKLRKVPTGPTQWAWFRAANRLLQTREDQPDLERMALYPPVFDDHGQVERIPTIPMIEDTGLKCRGQLTAAGLRWLHELAEFDAADVLSQRPTKTRPERGIKGVGPKAMDAIRVLLAEHGLTFADETPQEV